MTNEVKRVFNKEISSASVRKIRTNNSKSFKSLIFMFNLKNLTFQRF